MAMVHKNGYRDDIKTEELVTRYLNGETMYKIAKAYDTSVATIKYRLDKLGVLDKRNTDKKSRTDEEFISIVEECYNKLIYTFDNNENKMAARAVVVAIKEKLGVACDES